MLNTQFLYLYNTIKKDEVRFFRNFILSKIKLKNKDTLKLFEYIFNRKKLDEINSNKVKVFKYIYPNTEYDDLRMRHLIAEAKSTLEYYLAFYHFNHNEIDKDIHLLKENLNRKNYKSASQLIKNIDNSLEKKSERNINYYEKKLTYKEQKYLIETENKRDRINNYEDVIDIVIQKNMLEIFKHTCVFLAQNQFADNKAKTTYLENYLIEIKADKYKNNKVLQIYYNTYLILTETKKEDYFFIAKSLLDENFELFSTTELKDLHLILLNFCIKSYNQNKLEFGNIILEIYKTGIEQQFFLENNTLNKFIYTNYLTLSIRQNKIEEAHFFLEKYKQLIDIKFQEKTYLYNLSRLLYAKKEYKKAVRIILTVELEDDLWELNSKLLQLKILYETQEWELVNSGVFNFTQFIKRKKNIGYHKDYFLSIVKSFKYLLNANTKTKKELKIQIEKMTNSNEPEKDWFVEQLKLILR